MGKAVQKEIFNLSYSDEFQLSILNKAIIVISELWDLHQGVDER